MSAVEAKIIQDRRKTGGRIIKENVESQFLVCLFTLIHDRLPPSGGFSRKLTYFYLSKCTSVTTISFIHAKAIFTFSA